MIIRNDWRDVNYYMTEKAYAFYTVVALIIYFTEINKFCSPFEPKVYPVLNVIEG